MARLWVPWAESADGAAQVIDQRPGPDTGRLGWAGHSVGGGFTDSWLIWRAFSARSRKHFMKAATSTDYPLCIGSSCRLPT